MPHERPTGGRWPDEALDRELGDAPHGFDAGALGEDAELVAAEPDHERAREPLGGRAQRARHRLERPVAAVVAADVVELLEVVDVAQQQRDLVLLRDVLEREPEALLERAPVAEAGEAVLQRELGHAAEQLGAADAGGHLAGDRVEEPQVVRVEVGPARDRGSPTAPPRRRRRA